MGSSSPCFVWNRSHRFALNSPAIPKASCTVAVWYACGPLRGHRIITLGSMHEPLLP